MTDQEIVCGFMEFVPIHRPKESAPDYGCGISKETWWIYGLNRRWEPRELTLDALHEVEARLTDEQWEEYEHALASSVLLMLRDAIRLDDEQRIKALAAVLRPVVEGEDTHAQS